MRNKKRMAQPKKIPKKIIKNKEEKDNGKLLRNKENIQG